MMNIDTSSPTLDTIALQDSSIVATPLPSKEIGAAIGTFTSDGVGQLQEAPWEVHGLTNL